MVTNDLCEPWMPTLEPLESAPTAPLLRMVEPLRLAIKIQKLSRSDAAAFWSKRIPGDTWWTEVAASVFATHLVRLCVTEHLPMIYFPFMLTGARPRQYRTDEWSKGHFVTKTTYRELFGLPSPRSRRRASV